MIDRSHNDLHSFISEVFCMNALRLFYRGMNAFGHIWVVKTREQTPISFPDDDALLMLDQRPKITLLHPCAKAEEEMMFFGQAPYQTWASCPRLLLRNWHDAGCRQTPWPLLDRLRSQPPLLPDRHEQVG
jgi:hypothetical protein